MSIEHDATAIFGILINGDTCQALYETVPAKTIQKEQFDPDTGKSLGVKTIEIDSEHRAIIVDGEEYGSFSFEEGLSAIIDPNNEHLDIRIVKNKDAYNPGGYVIGCHLDDKNGDEVISIIQKMNEHAPRIAEAINKRLVAVHPGVLKNSSAMVSSDTKVHSILLSY
jgi:hypothetical protein